MQSIRSIGGAWILLLALLPWPAWSQRIRYGSQVTTPVTAAPSATTYAAPAPAYASPATTYAAPAASPAVVAPSAVPFQGTGQAVTASPNGGVTAVPIQPPTTAPTYGPGVSPGPTMNFQSAVQPPPTTWDPYATPGGQSPSLLSQDPYFPSPPGAPATGAAPATKFRQQIHLAQTWIPGSSSQQLGVHEMEVAGTFTFPFLYNEQSPLLITPGLGIQTWNGPKDQLADLPPATYDAFIEAGWNPQPVEWLEGDLAIRTGVYSDFERVNVDSLRFLGRGILGLRFSPSLQIKGGIVYLDRVRVKLLPAGGVVWTPSADVRFDIVFPNPKLASRFTTIGNTDWWWYVRGEYGGGSWTIHRTSGDFDQVDYNDIRVAVGVDWIALRGWQGYFETGLSFNRELIYKHDPASEFKPDPMIFLGAGIAF